MLLVYPSVLNPALPARSLPFGTQPTDFAQRIDQLRHQYDKMQHNGQWRLNTLVARPITGKLPPKDLGYSIGLCALPDNLSASGVLPMLHQSVADALKAAGFTVHTNDQPATYFAPRPETFLAHGPLHFTLFNFELNRPHRPAVDLHTLRHTLARQSAPIRLRFERLLLTDKLDVIATFLPETPGAFALRDQLRTGPYAQQHYPNIFHVSLFRLSPQATLGKPEETQQLRVLSRTLASLSRQFARSLPPIQVQSGTVCYNQSDRGIRPWGAPVSMPIGGVGES